jgi:hypothetical protein
MIAARWAAVNVLFRIAIFFVKLDNFVKSNLYYFLGAEIGKWTYTLHNRKKIYLATEYHKKINNQIVRFIYSGDSINAGYPDVLKMNALISINTYEDSLRYWRQLYAKQAHFVLGKMFARNTYNYLTLFSDLASIKPYQDSTSLPLFENASALYQSFIANYYKNVLSYRSSLKSTPELSDTASFLQYVPKNAVEKILEKSVDYRVVMLNEDHLNSYSRFFAKQLLPGLWEQGYRYLALEALDYRDASINARKYPTQRSGIYISDPAFSNFLRTALNMGFVLLPYEADDPPVQLTDYKAIRQFREKSQAENIMSILKRDNKAKIFVYAGHGHIYKRNSKSTLKMMAQIFKEEAGLEPLCIEQTMMTESFNALNENLYYALCQRLIRHEGSIVFQKKDTIWVNPADTGKYDIQVFHPRTMYVKNQIPTWMTVNGQYNKVFKLNKLKFEHQLFQIFYFQERETENGYAVPLINIVLGRKNRFNVNLDKGTYVAMIRDVHGISLYYKKFKI